MKIELSQKQLELIDLALFVKERSLQEEYLDAIRQYKKRKTPVEIRQIIKEMLSEYTNLRIWLAAQRGWNLSANGDIIPISI